jgi:hypothetical protein
MIIHRIFCGDYGTYSPHIVRRMISYAGPAFRRPI